MKQHESNSYVTRDLSPEFDPDVIDTFVETGKTALRGITQAVQRGKDWSNGLIQDVRHKFSDPEL